MGATRPLLTPWRPSGRAFLKPARVTAGVPLLTGLGGVRHFKTSNKRPRAGAFPTANGQTASMSFSSRTATRMADVPRRRLLIGGAASMMASMAGVRSARASVPPAAKSLCLENLHTGESIDTCYWNASGYVSGALRDVSRVLRDHRTGEVHFIEPALLDILYKLNARLETQQPFQVISGYRSPVSNAALAAASDGVAKKSLHMEGKAIDIRIPGVALHVLRDAAVSLRAGGVGYYPKSDFVHVDMGRVRYW